MPRLANTERPQNILTASVGGSTLFCEPHWWERLFGRKEVWDTQYVSHLCKFLKRQTDDGRIVIAIVGGGRRARREIETAQRAGLTDQAALDSLGIAVTIKNAYKLGGSTKRSGAHVEYYTPDLKLQSGVIYLGHGDEPNHTTDRVAVEAAHRAGQVVMLNISVAGVIHPMKEGKPDKSMTLQEMTWDDYIRNIAQEHKAGRSSPFDLPAAELAKEYGMTVVFVGPDIDNVARCLNGEDFVGTIIHP